MHTATISNYDLQSVAQNTPKTHTCLEQICMRSGGLGKKETGIKVYINSPYLARRFRCNWPTRPRNPPVPHSVTIFVEDAPSSGAKKNEKISRRCWTIRCQPTNYSDFKIAFRGIMSAIGNKETLYAHGCSFSIKTGLSRPKGVLLLGASGAGKTTLISQLVKTSEFKLVNDDWGPVNLRTGQAMSTFEPYIHMKRDSIRAINPTADKSKMVLFEEGKDTTRCMVLKKEVYSAVISQTKLDQIILLGRLTDQPSGLLSLTMTEILQIFERGFYSPYYNRREAFCDGSLLIDSPQDALRYRKKFETLFSQCHVSFINNTGTRDELKEAFFSIIGGNERK